LRLFTALPGGHSPLARQSPDDEQQHHKFAPESEKVFRMSLLSLA
jgi:hypothetical protein